MATYRPQPTPKPNTKSEAYALGRQAFLDGKTAVPIHDPNLVALLTPAIGSNIQTLVDWSAGWHRANLKAPVPGLED